MKLAEFDYEVPGELVAQLPPDKRGASRLMVLDRRTRQIFDRGFEGIIDYVREGDCVVLNNTRVIRARLIGRRRSGGKVELFLLEELEKGFYHVLMRSSRRLKTGEEISFDGDSLKAVFLKRTDPGGVVKFSSRASLKEVLSRVGRVPLPPYIKREPSTIDEDRYQTVYARIDGATAAPTAGLHFTDTLLARLKTKGVKICFVTLHTSYGTFAPVKTEDVEKYTMHREYYELSQEAARTVNETKKTGGSVFCVGTTTCRTLESCAVLSDAVRPERGYTGLYIYPGYKFKVTDHLVTNFHFPKSTLLLLVSAFAGKEFVFRAYRHAIEAGYRFFSYGDAMLIL